MSKALFKATAVVSSMTFISRILGFIRDVVLAHSFGAGTGTDAFFVAFRIPNFMRRLFAEGGFSQAFVPVLSEYKQQRSHEELQELVNRVAGTLGMVLFMVTALGIVASPLLIGIFAPGFSADESKYQLTVEMLRITFPYLLFISLTALAGALLNSFERFAVPALTPVLLNIAMIVATIGVAPYLEKPIIALAWSVLAAGLIQLLFQLPYLKALRVLPRPRWGWRFEGVKRVIRLMIPTLFGSSVAQINLLFDTLLASFLVTGSISWLYYSERLVEFPLGLFGVALGVVILPSLSQLHAAASVEEFSHTLDWALRWVFLIGLPAMLGLAMLAGPLLCTLFQYGAFGSEDVQMASRSLMAYSLGLVAFMLIRILAPAFYARHNTRIPVRMAIIAMIANMALNVILIFPLAHAGLALATSLSSSLNAALLFLALRRENIYQPCSDWRRFFIRIGGANLLMALILWCGMGELSDWLESGSGERIVHLTWLILAGGSIYLIGIVAAGIRPHHLVNITDPN
jgi:putative peptidoglycan lipid II flippase